MEGCGEQLCAKERMQDDGPVYILSNIPYRDFWVTICCLVVGRWSSLGSFPRGKLDVNGILGFKPQALCLL
jgi:hypothetical protein